MKSEFSEWSITFYPNFNLDFVDIFDEKYYRHLSGGILEAFGKLFYRDLKVYLYPMKADDGSVIKILILQNDNNYIYINLQFNCTNKL